MKKLTMVFVALVTLSSQLSVAQSSGLLNRLMNALDEIASVTNSAKNGVIDGIMVAANQGTRIKILEEAAVNGARTSNKLSITVSSATNDFATIKRGNTLLNSELDVVTRMNPRAVEAVIGNDYNISHFLINVDEVDAGALTTALRRAVARINQDASATRPPIGGGGGGGGR